MDRGMLGVIFSFVPVMGALETGMECGLWRDPEELTVKGPALAVGIPGSSRALHLLMTRAHAHFVVQN